MPGQAAEALEVAFRDEHVRIIASLARVLGDIDRGRGCGRGGLRHRHPGMGRGRGSAQPPAVG